MIELEIILIIGVITLFVIAYRLKKIIEHLYWINKNTKKDE